MDNKREAISTLTYYFRLIGQKAGVNWDSDNDAEIRYAVECIFDGIEDTLKEYGYEKDADIPGDFGTHQITDIG